MVSPSFLFSDYLSIGQGYTVTFRLEYDFSFFYRTLYGKKEVTGFPLIPLDAFNQGVCCDDAVKI